MDIESRWISDPEHKKRPDWATTKTPKGWSDRLPKSQGSHSFVDIDERISESVGFPVSMNTEEKIPQLLGNVTNEQSIALQYASEAEINELYKNCRNSMRIDLAIQAKHKEDFPFPVFVEADGSQHERNNRRGGSSEVHIDRVKDFCCRLNKKGIMIRVKSNADSSKKVEYIFKELKRYYDMFSEDNPKNRIRAKVQEYADAMCFEFCQQNGGFRKSEAKIRPGDFISNIQEKIAERMLNDKDFNPEEIKLLSTWVRDRKDLSKFICVLKSVEGEKDVTHPVMYRGKYYTPYTFMEGVMSKLKRNFS